MIINVGGNETFVATGGQNFDPKKPTVVFVHGSGLDHRCWALQSRWFAFHGYSVFAPDFPGHSLSKGEPLLSIEEMGEWLVEALVVAGVESIHLVGHSMGFLIVLESASLLGDRLKTITAVASAAAIPVNEELILTAETSASDAADMMLRWGFGSHTQLGSSAVPGMQPIAIGRQIMSDNPLAIDLKACRDYSAGKSRAESLSYPANVILADEDKMTPCNFGLELASSLNANVSTIKNSGHMLPMESPKRTLDAIKSFVIKNSN
ncbi:MAG TPA: alpha/beta hydrolase [Candidatus Thioglobus sp.]|jgi:pimeloyl-ACP methyl ester carboxylesterase|nr:alpha/beta hydrolase [Candidatus Thioglobus sp.]